MWNLSKGGFWTKQCVGAEVIEQGAYVSASLVIYPIEKRKRKEKEGKGKEKKSATKLFA